MENNINSDLCIILTEERFVRAYHRVFWRKKHILYNELTDRGPLAVAVEFVIFLTTKEGTFYRSKYTQPYLLRLLVIKEVYDSIKTWRDKKNNNILHYACRNSRCQVIESIITYCGEDLINQKNSKGDLPLWKLLRNSAHSLKISMKNILELLINKTNDGENSFKHAITRNTAWRFSTSFIAACFERYEDIEDESKIDKSIIVELLKRYIKDFGIWNRHKYLRIRKTKMFQLLKRITLPPAMIADLFRYIGKHFWKLVRYQPKLRKPSSYQPELFAFLLKGIDVDTKFTGLWQRYSGPETAQVIVDRWWFNKKGLDVEFIVNLVNVPEMYEAIRKFMVNSWVFKSTVVHPLLAKDVYDSIMNQDFKRDIIRILTEHYVNGPVIAPEMTDFSAIVEFPPMDLPGDLLQVVMIFLPYSKLLAFAMTCKRCYLLLDSQLIWKQKFQGSYPFDAKPKEYTRRAYVSRYKNKFHLGEPVEIKFESSWKNIYAVHQNLVTKTRNDKDYFELYDLETLSLIKIKAQGQSTYQTRRFGDHLYVATDIGVELFSLYDYKPSGVLDILGVKKVKFDVNERWLVTGSQVFDVTTGTMLYDLGAHQKYSTLLRDNMAIRVTGSKSFEVLDLRMSLEEPVVVQLHGDTALDARHHPHLNVSDTYIYIASSHVEISDIRKPNKPIWISPIKLDCNRAKDVSCIDLVSMNAWCNGNTGDGTEKIVAVWDLVNYKWDWPDRYNNIKVSQWDDWCSCNGKHMVYKKSSQCFYMDAAGSEYFPLSSS